MKQELFSPKDIERSGLCIGCGSCVAQAKDESLHMNLDGYGHYKPEGPTSWFRHRSERFSRTCPFSPVARDEDQLAAELFPQPAHRDHRVGSFQSAYVGYVAEEEFRLRGSSGGMVSWVLEELLRQGLVDGIAHVAPVDDPQKDGRFFRYRIARTVEEIRAGAKSRYYPVELSEVLESIRKAPGRYAVVGVPCFIKALQLLRREDAVLRERIALHLVCSVVI
jgi:coenzyme F420-reducing hydrogenase beta subunit